MKIIETKRLADLLRKEKQLEYLKRIVSTDIINHVNRLLIDDDSITVLDELKKDDDYWTQSFADYLITIDDSDINYD